MPTCDTDKNLAGCNCSYEGCSRKGKCCECLAYHRRNGQLPACYFPEDVERTYDRSAAAFVRTFQARGKCW
jgi:hypothetical protein